ncbi:MAG: hypothetical protein QXP27_08910, partial [Candidatus Methanomethyliaceae archaeon]
MGQHGVVMYLRVLILLGSYHAIQSYWTGDEVVTISRTCTIGSAMVFITILFSGIVSLFVSIAVNV